MSGTNTTQAPSFDYDAFVEAINEGRRATEESFLEGVPALIADAARLGSTGIGGFKLPENQFRKLKQQLERENNTAPVIFNVFGVSSSGTRIAYIEWRLTEV